MGCNCDKKECVEIEKIESLTSNIIARETEAIIKTLCKAITSQSHAIKAAVISAYIQGIYDAKSDRLDKNGL